MKIRPLADRIVVKKEEKTNRKSEGGLFIPDSVSEQGSAAVGQVIDVGEGIYNEKGVFLRALNVKAGDRVLFGKYAGVEAVINDTAYLLMQEVDILGIIED